MNPPFTLLPALLLALPADKPLGFTAYADWPRIEFQAGVTKTVTAGGKLKEERKTS